MIASAIALKHPFLGKLAQEACPEKSLMTPAMWSCPVSLEIVHPSKLTVKSDLLTTSILMQHALCAICAAHCVLLSQECTIGVYTFDFDRFVQFGTELVLGMCGTIGHCDTALTGCCVDNDNDQQLPQHEIVPLIYIMQSGDAYS